MTTEKPVTEMTLVQLMTVYGNLCDAMRDYERDDKTYLSRYDKLRSRAKEIMGEAARRDDLPVLSDSIQEALNSGDGTYRP